MIKLNKFPFTILEYNQDPCQGFGTGPMEFQPIEFMEITGERGKESGLSKITYFADYSTPFCRIVSNLTYCIFPDGIKEHAWGFSITWQLPSGSDSPFQGP